MIFNPNTMPSHSLGLTFKIVGSDTEPTATSENLIWINTIVTDIPNWGFGAAEPAAATNGDVWIRTGDSSPAAFNATKKNTIMIYPICAHQYINGKWQEVEAKIYCDNKWVNVPKAAVYLLKDGVQNIDLTGGWSGIASDAIVLSKSVDDTPSGVGVPGYVSTQTINKIDVTNYSLISARVDSLDKNMCIQLIGDSNNIVGRGDTLTGAGVVTMDLQSVTGEYYIKFDVDGSYATHHATASFTISEVKLEK